MQRPLQGSLVGGGLAHIALRVLEDLAGSSVPFQAAATAANDFLCPDCPAWTFDHFEALHPPSLAWGILIGLLVGPLLDLFQLGRVAWASFVRARLRRARANEPLFRILS